MKQNLLSLLAICIFLLFGCEKETEQNPVKATKPLSYETLEYSKYLGKCDSTENNCTYVKFIYPKFDTGNNPAADSLNKYVNYALLASYEMEMYESYDAVAQSIFEDYNSIKADFEDYTITWALEKKIEFKAHKNIATLHYTEYSYMGGAHPNYVFEYYNFDAATGKRLTVDDLVLPDKKIDLLQLGEKKFRGLKGISEDQNLEAAGYWFENNKFYLAESFSLSDSGLVFLYNPYEIAPYAEGVTELFIANDELRDILK